MLSPNGKLLQKLLVTEVVVDGGGVAVAAAVAEVAAMILFRVLLQWPHTGHACTKVFVCRPGILQLT